MLEVLPEAFMQQTFGHFVIVLVRDSRWVVLAEQGFELVVLPITEMFWQLEIRRAVHVAGAEAAKDREQIDLADMSKAKEEVKREVAAAEAHQLDRLWEEFLSDVQAAVGQDLVLLVVDC